MQLSYIKSSALCILLIAAQLLSSCQSASETIETTQSETTADITTAVPDELKSGVPDDVSFNGEVIRILNAPSQSPELLDADETNGDVLNDSSATSTLWKSSTSHSNSSPEATTTY